MTPFSKQLLIHDLKNAGILPGMLLHVKVSMRALGQVEGGAETLLEALLDVVGDQGTIVADAFIESYPLPFAKCHRGNLSTIHSPSYAGAFVNAMIEHPQMHRSRHPIQRFVAIGAKAKSLMEAHTPQSNGYWVMEQLAALGAYNLNIGASVIGVGTTHVAVEKTGLKKKIVPRGVNYINENGESTIFKVNWSGGCNKGFVKFVPLYQKEGLIVTGKVGNAQTSLTKMQDTLNLEMAILKKNPAFFFCDNPTCKDCRLRWEHSTGSWLKVKWYSALAIMSRVLKKQLR